MAKLSAAQRKALPKSAFAIPGKAPASGSYPINDPSHARNALARSAGKPVAGKVRAKVKSRYPGMVSKSVAAHVVAAMGKKKPMPKHKMSTKFTPPGYTDAEDKIDHGADEDEE